MTMGDKVKVINLTGTYQKWDKLLHYLQNNVCDIFQLVFDDKETALESYRKMHKNIKGATWFTLALFCRGNCVYAVKTDRAQKVVIRDV